VQQVERERVAAQQVVVDDERPDEVVGAQHVERVAISRLRDSRARSSSSRASDLRLVDEHLELAGRVKSISAVMNVALAMRLSFFAAM
jgi:hypothetical protein